MRADPRLSFSTRAHARAAPSTPGRRLVAEEQTFVRDVDFGLVVEPCAAHPGIGPQVWPALRLPLGLRPRPSLADDPSPPRADRLWPSTSGEAERASA